jgi:hypothetical protein
MERIYLLVKKLIAMLIFSNLIIGFSECSKLPLPKQEDLVGEWKSSLDEMMFLHDDSTFIIKNFITDEFIAKFVDETLETIIDVEGRWNIYKNMLCLHFKYYTLNSITKEAKFGNTYIIRGSGFFENRLPWYIYTFKGHVDTAPMIIYKKVK